MNIEEIWEVSRHNDYTWMLPFVLGVGALVLILVSCIRKSAVRRTLKVLFALLFTYFAMQASFAAIAEKWRIRHEWADKQNWESLTQKERDVLCADGANLTLGPVIFGGGFSFLIFGTTLVASSIFSRIVLKKRAKQEKNGIGELSQSKRAHGAPGKEIPEETD